MKTRRIRQINVLELDQAMYSSTYQYGLEMANWLNASMHVCMLESQEQREFSRGVYGPDSTSAHLITRNQIEGIINEVKVKGELMDLGLSIRHFDEEESIKNIFQEITLAESFAILGYNKSTRHKEVLKRLLKFDLGNPLMLVPMGKDLSTFHKMVVPFQPQFVTKKKLANLKWYADQLGVMIEFVHFKQSGEDNDNLTNLLETIFTWIKELDFYNSIQFKSVVSTGVKEGLNKYLEGEENYLVCIIDNAIRSLISTSSTNKECLMDIKETVVIL